MIFLEIKAVPQCLPIHSQSCTMRQLNLDIDIRRTFEGIRAGASAKKQQGYLSFTVKFIHTCMHTYIQHTYINDNLAWL